MSYYTHCAYYVVRCTQIITKIMPNPFFITVEGTKHQCNNIIGSINKTTKTVGVVC